MRRWPIALLAGLAGLTPPAAAVAAISSPLPAPRAQLVGFACHQALDPPNRSMSVRAIMRPVSGTGALELRFVLLVRRPGAPGFASVHAGDLGRWLSPRDRTLGQNPADVWIFHKAVYELRAPATYRFQVWFRWQDTSGAPLATVVRYSPRCHQRELRPDLTVLAPIVVTPVAGQPGEDLYTATIANRGGSGAGPFEVEFVPGQGASGASASVSTQTVSWLGVDQEVTLTFTGPACATAGPPTIIADSTLEVDDSRRADNSLTAVCPAVGPPAQGQPPPN